MRPGQDQLKKSLLVEALSDSYSLLWVREVNNISNLLRDE